ncbi:PKD-like family lipoprotein [Pedobacter deserti]|uniref:PKD-like family lipoprotein n=1 Tax=Pedobacter deserti TaxID=2817382 RepID=UPI00210ECDD3|nr:PKD-like family lipoprotein [Pedobacter sp. SYSU D00382]
MYYIKHKILNIIMLMVILIVSCKKEEGKEDYKLINDITIETPTESSLVRSLNDSLIITPVLKESMPAGDDYSYSWTINDSLVSVQKDLRMLVDLPVKTGYKVWFKATNKATGVQAMYQYDLEVKGTYYGGWYVAHNKDGKARFSFIREDDVIFTNPLEEVNQKTYSGSALGLYHAGAYAYGGSTYSGYIFAFTSQGVWRFDRDNLKEIHDISEIVPSFGSFPLLGKPFQADVPAFYIDQVLILNGGVYAGPGPAFPDYELGAFDEVSAGDYDMFPGAFFLASTSPAYYYDNKNKRFMTLPQQSNILSVAAVTTGSFNFANVGRTLLAYDTGLTSSREYYFIMADATNVKYLMSAVANGSGTTPGINQRIEGPNINLASKFVTSSTQKQMYYAVNNEIYLYNILTNTAQLIYSFPVGYVVKDMRKSGATRIVVATASGSAGEVYYFDLAATGEFNGNTYVKKYVGFGDIVQVTQR